MSTPSIVTSAAGQRMLKMEPDWLRNDPVLQRLLQVYGTEADAADAWIGEILRQLFIRDKNGVASASWGLDYWEEVARLSYGGNLTNQERADRVVAKLRSYRQATPYVVRLVANSFQNGTVDAVEDFTGRRLIIRFVSIGGVPPNVSDLQAAIERLVRASAIIEYQFTMLTWGEIKTAATTWQQVKTAGRTWATLRGMRPNQLP
jgi:hypothetical protein